METFVKNTGAGTLTITPATSTINGQSSLPLATNLGAMIWSDGTNYHAYVFPLTKPLLAANNLADLANAATALTNLGVDQNQRANSCLDRIYQSKLLASYRRVVSSFADGYKNSDGINAGASSNYTLDTSNGKVSPTITSGSQISTSGKTSAFMGS